MDAVTFKDEFGQWVVFEDFYDLDDLGALPAGVATVRINLLDDSACIGITPQDIASLRDWCERLLSNTPEE